MIKKIINKINTFFSKLEKKSPVKMLEDKEIDNLHSKINIDIVTEGVRQAENRLKGTLDTQKLLEQKASILLSSYTVVSIAIFPALGFLISNNSVNHFSLAFIISSNLLFVLSAVILTCALEPSDYGTLGCYPDTWLQSGIIDGDENTRSTMMARLLHDYQDKIWVSDNNNTKKSRLLNLGICIGRIGLIFILIGLSPYAINLFSA